MKYSLLLLPILLLAACQKKPQYESSTIDCKKALYATGLYHDLPNWEPSWMISEPTSESVSGKDSMEAVLHEGRSYLRYHKQGYLLLVANKKRQYKEGDSLHLVGVYDSDCKLMCYAQVRPSRYLDNGRWVKQKQTFKVLDMENPVLAPFDANGQTYSSFIPWKP